jgi:hypothetical protein
MHPEPYKIVVLYTGRNHPSDSPKKATGGEYSDGSFYAAIYAVILRREAAKNPRFSLWLAQSDICFSVKASFLLICRETMV